MCVTTVANVWEKQLFRKKDLFELLISVALAHGWLTAWVGAWSAAGHCDREVEIGQSCLSHDQGTERNNRKGQHLPFKACPQATNFLPQRPCFQQLHSPPVVYSDLSSLANDPTYIRSEPLSSSCCWKTPHRQSQWRTSVIFSAPLHPVKWHSDLPSGQRGGREGSKKTLARITASLVKLNLMKGILPTKKALTRSGCGCSQTVSLWWQKLMAYFPSPKFFAPHNDYKLIFFS